MSQAFRCYALYAENIPALRKKNRSGWVKIVNGITGRLPKVTRRPVLLNRKELEELIDFFNRNYPDVLLVRHHLKPYSDDLIKVM